jgi:hypothetical protein
MPPHPVRTHAAVKSALPATSLLTIDLSTGFPPANTFGAAPVSGHARTSSQHRWRWRKPGPSAKVQQVQQLMMAFARPLPTTQVCDLTRPRIDAF